MSAGAWRSLAALAVGTLFGAGLAVSQMMDPAKVIGFLDVAGRWDPTLAVVMAGALLGAVPGFALARGRSQAWLGAPVQIPTRRDIDGRLVGGAALFGIGWGLAGFCPGPALSAMSTGLGPVFVYVAAMVAGMLCWPALQRVLPRPRRTAAGAE